MIKVFCVWERTHSNDRCCVAAFFDESKAVALKNELEMDEYMKRNNDIHHWWREYSVSTLEVE